MLGEAAAQQPRVDHAAKQGFFVAILEPEQPLGGDPVDRLLLGGGREVEVVVRAPLQRFAAAAPREDEIDRGQNVEAPQLLDDLEKVVGGQPREPTDAIGGLLFFGGLGPRALVDAAVLLEQGIETVLDGQPHLQLDRPDVVEDGLHAAAVLGHPLRDLAIVADGRREADQLDGSRRLDDDLLPDRASRKVVDVVDLVENHVVDEVQSLGVLVDEVAQDLGRHHDHRRVVVDGVLTCDQPNRPLAILSDEVVILLVAQRLERRRVDDLGAFAQGPKDRVLGHHRLAAGGRRADEDAAGAGVQLVDRLALERIELEGKGGLKIFGEGFDGVHSRTSSVDTLVIRAPSQCDSMYESAAARTSSAWRPSALTQATAISASCQRSRSPTSAAATWNSERTRLSSPLTTWRLLFREPLSGIWRTTLSKPTARGDDILRLD